MAGTGTSDIAWSPEYLLRAGLPGVAVVLKAVPGTTSADAVPLTGSANLSNFGVNDARLAVPIATYKANLRRIAAAPGSILQTPTPMTGPLSNGQSTAPYAQAVREVGLELGVPVADVQAYVLSLPNWQMLLVDGVHPDDALYRMMIGNVVLPVVAREVARLRCQG